LLPGCWNCTNTRATKKTDQEKRLITQEIESTDRQIDSLVYGLYGLTTDEIAVLEDLVGKLYEKYMILFSRCKISNNIFYQFFIFTKIFILPTPPLPYTRGEVLM